MNFGQEDPPPDLAQLQGRRGVLLHEGGFDGHEVGPVAGDDLAEPRVDAQDPLVESGPAGRADHAQWIEVTSVTLAYVRCRGFWRQDYGRRSQPLSRLRMACGALLAWAIAAMEAC